MASRQVAAGDHYPFAVRSYTVVPPTVVEL
jgi:hypothetical protein